MRHVKLINLYINDFLNGLSGIRIEGVTIPGFMFFNDVVILSKSPQALQDDLDKI